MTQEETQRCADSFGGVQAACNSSLDWLHVCGASYAQYGTSSATSLFRSYASELPPQDEPRVKSNLDEPECSAVPTDSLSVIKGERERYIARETVRSRHHLTTSSYGRCDKFVNQSLATALFEFVKLQVVHAAAAAAATAAVILFFCVCLWWRFL